MNADPLRPPNPEQARTDLSGHNGQQCPFVRLLTPEIVSQLEDAIALVRDTGRHDLSDRLDAWLVRVTRVSATIAETGECRPELYLG
jgi:hypothetical protein